MTTVIRSALQHLRIDADEVLINARTGIPFDVRAYSRMKYGDASVAREWGVKLAINFVAAHADIAFDATRRVIVTGPSYKYLSTAAQGIAESFSTVINSARVTRGIEPTIPLHIIRAWVGSDSYAMASREEREKQLPKGGQHVDHGLVKDSIVIVIDDVSITGTTEDKIREHLEEADPALICFLHVADVDRTQALENSQIENAMNKVVEPTLDDFMLRIDMQNMRLNSRVFRTIMESSTTQYPAFEWFIERAPDSFLETMYDALVGGTCEMFNRYPLASQRLREELYRRELHPRVMILDFDV